MTTQLPIRITLDLVVTVDDQIVHTRKDVRPSAVKVRATQVSTEDVRLTAEEEAAIARQHAEIENMYSPMMKRRKGFASAPSESTMVNDLVFVLDSVGGKTTLLKVIHEIKALRKAAGRPVTKSIRNNVRSELTRNSADGAGKGRDLFRKLKRGTNGQHDNDHAIWGLTPEGEKLAAQIRALRPATRKNGDIVVTDRSTS